MARAEVAPILAKDFVELKIDTDRMVGGADVLAAARGTDQGGIPWFVFLDAEGGKLATSDGPAGNIGCPYAEEEIAHFVTMLGKARVRISADEVELLRKSLVAVREEDEARKKAQKPAGD